MNRLRAQGFGNDYPAFTVERAAGSGARLVFSDDALAAKVPGLYSYDGYHKGFQSQVARVVGQLNDEQSWVLGVDATRTLTLPMVENSVLEDQVRRLYLNDYTAAWKAFIVLVRIKPLGNTTDAIQTAQQLAAPDTPLRPLMTKIARETTLSVDQTGGVSALASGVTSSVLAGGRALTGALSGSKIQADSAVEKQLVDDQFVSIRNLVASGSDGKAPIDRVIGQIAEVQGQLIAAERAVQAHTAPPPSSATPALMAEASQLPEPVRTLLTTLTQQGSRQTMAGLRVNLSDEIRADMGEFCQQAFGGRYPFDRNAQREAQLQDFAAVFAPGGKFDQLMTKIGPYVDTTARTWRLRPIDGTSLGDSGALVQLQRAQAIRDTFFAGTAVADDPRHLQAAGDGPVPVVVQPRHRRPGDPLSAWPAVRHHRDVARIAHDQPGAAERRPGAAARHARPRLRRAVGAAADDRPDQAGTDQRAGTFHRDLQHRAAHGAVRGERDERPQSADDVRTARLPLPDGSLTRTTIRPDPSMGHPLQQEPPGWYGKIASLGDFAHRRLPQTWIARCDAWLSTALPAARASLGSRWMDTYLTAPVLRFAWAPGIVDRHWWIGILMPSCDNVGRYFPLIIARPLPQAPHDRLDAFEDWYTDATGIALRTLDDAGGSLAALESALGGMAVSPNAQRTPGRDEVARQAPALTRMTDHSLWWVAAPAGSGHIDVVEGLPDGVRLAHLLDGGASIETPSAGH